MPLPSNAHLIWHPFVGYCQHEERVPPIGISTMVGYIDFGVVNGITGLFAWPTAEFPFPPARKPGRGSILDMGVPMEGHGTDATLMVVHIPVLPPVPGYLLALIILFGSSKIIMASNRTRIWCKGLTGLSGEMEQAVGCCVFPYIPLSINLQCWDFKCKKYEMNIGAPMMSDVVVAPNTVQVGIGLSDYVKAMVEWAIEIALAIVLAFATKVGTDKLAKRSASKLAKAKKAATEAYDKALEEGLEKGLSREAAKEAAQAARKAAFADATKKNFASRIWSRVASTNTRKAWAIAIGAKLPYKMLVKNTEWYRDVKRPVQDKIRDGQRLL